MTERYKVGDKFKIAHPHGSYGVITYVREDGPFKGNPVYYGTYYYGLDARGKDVTASTDLLRAEEIERVTEEAFEARRSRRFNQS